MGRVLKPSVKAISVSQTCCFPTEATCQSGDLQPPGKHTHIHTHAHGQTPSHTHEHQRRFIGAAKHTSMCIYTERVPGCKGTD